MGTSERLLHLLPLLRARRDWTGTELATRPGVTTRSIRNDMDRLRRLGYPVEGRPGVAGGYRLGTHGRIGDLLLVVMGMADSARVIAVLCDLVEHTVRDPADRTSPWRSASTCPSSVLLATRSWRPGAP